MDNFLHKKNNTKLLGVGEEIKKKTHKQTNTPKNQPPQKKFNQSKIQKLQ